MESPLDDYEVSACESLRGLTTGHAVPIYAIDVAGEGGKIPVEPNYVPGYRNAMMTLRNYCGEIYPHHEPERGGSWP